MSAEAYIQFKRRYLPLKWHLLLFEKRVESQLRDSNGKFLGPRFAMHFAYEITLLIGDVTQTDMIGAFLGYTFRECLYLWCLLWININKSVQKPPETPEAAWELSVSSYVCTQKTGAGYSLCGSSYWYQLWQKYDPDTDFMAVCPLTPVWCLYLFLPFNW